MRVLRGQLVRRRPRPGYQNFYADMDRSRELPEFRGFGEFQSDRQLGWSFKSLVKGAVKYANPIGLSVVAAKAAAGLARKTSLGRTVLNAAAYLPGGSELLTLVGGGGGGGGKKAPARPRPKPKAKIQIRRAVARAVAPPPQEEEAPPEELEEEAPAEEEETEEETTEEETEEEPAEDAELMEGLAQLGGLDALGFSFSSLIKSVGKGLAVAGKTVGKVGLAVGKTALETYIGRPLGGTTPAQQKALLAAAVKKKAAVPIWKNPLAVGGAAVALVGGAVLLTRGKKRR